MSSIDGDTWRKILRRDLTSFFLIPSAQELLFLSLVMSIAITSCWKWCKWTLIQWRNEIYATLVSSFQNFFPLVFSSSSLHEASVSLCGKQMYCIFFKTSKSFGQGNRLDKLYHDNDQLRENFCFASFGL